MNIDGKVYELTMYIRNTHRLVLAELALPIR